MQEFQTSQIWKIALIFLHKIRVLSGIFQGFTDLDF
jgi:hypothetical protein